MRRRGISQLLQIILFPKVFYEVTVLTAGSMVLPTLWHSLHDETVYPDPYKFKPSRWSPDGIAEQHSKYVQFQIPLICRNWLVFGAGPHVCLGQNYAIMHLMMCLGKASLFLNWDHKTTDVSDNIRYNLISTFADEIGYLLRYSLRTIVC
jgi:sterol 22-desaturase